MIIINQRKLEDQTMQFLRGLNDQYHNIRSYVLLLECIPPITKIFSFVVQQERQLINNALITNVNSVIVTLASLLLLLIFVVKLVTSKMFVIKRTIFTTKKKGLTKA